MKIDLTPHRRAASVLLAAVLASSCIYVRVRGDLSEAAWLDDVVHDNHAVPASFHHGEANFELEGFLWNHEGRLEMDFSCAPEDLDAYAASVRNKVEEKIEDEGYEVVSLRQTSNRSWEYEYAEDHTRGRVTIEIVDRKGKERYPHRLELRWAEH